MSLQWRDNISPTLAKLARDIANRKPILQAMGAELQSITIRAFRDASLRALPWPPKKDGTNATLYKSGALKHSIRITKVTNDHVTVGSDRPYAAIQQLGGQTAAHIIRAKYARSLYFPKGAISINAKSVNHPGSKIPARPFFPFRPDGTLLPEARRKIEAVARAKITSIIKQATGK